MLQIRKLNNNADRFYTFWCTETKFKIKKKSPQRFSIIAGTNFFYIDMKNTDFTCMTDFLCILGL